ncbi:rhodopsin, GQ-coupled-like [Tachypleus tridentatus]|uniref:rhodopsin, GQ-coupled-like n=1 Tax=Tachypleus tridentatus TaxID=6853 RepID=UPI003FD5E8FF
MKMENVTSFWNDTKHLTDPTRHLSIINQVLLTFFYVFGISSNICSLVMLARNETIRNRKQTLMVRCLVWNDLLALVGSSALMYTQLYLWSELIIPRWFCMLRVLLRTFGLSSGCVAIVMAVERWLALTRPFQYQKHVTYTRIKQAIFSLWIVVLLLVCLPFLGFGVYYDSNAADKRFMCIRYRFATKSKDKVYAYLMFVFGLVLCLVIVYCNLAVVRVLCRMGKKCMARIGRTTIRKDSRELSYNHTTPEEISFAKFMVILCVFFVVCWVPQLVSLNSSYNLFYHSAILPQILG